MDKIDIKKFKDMCEENTALALRAASLQHQLQKEGRRSFLSDQRKISYF